MDLNTIVWIVGLCLALQCHHGDQLLALGSVESGQGAQQSTFMEKKIEAMVVEAELIS